MTRNEYAQYEARFARGVKGLEVLSTGPCPGCDECGLSEDPSEAQRELASEPHFSWSPCDICGSTLGGHREYAHAWLGSTLVHLSLCVDCVYYANYGRLDDSTMADIEANSESEEA